MNWTSIFNFYKRLILNPQGPQLTTSFMNIDPFFNHVLKQNF